MIKRYYRMWVVFAALSLLLGTVGLAPATAGHQHKEFACPYHRGESYGYADMDGRFFRKSKFYLENATEIGLLDEQREKIKKLTFDVQKEMIRKDAEIQILGLDLQEGLHADRINVEALSGIVDQKYEAKKAKTRYLIQALADLKGVLTDEQLAKAKELWLKKE